MQLILLGISHSPAIQASQPPSGWDSIVNLFSVCPLLEFKPEAVVIFWVPCIIVLSPDYSSLPRPRILEIDGFVSCGYAFDILVRVSAF